MDAALVVDVGGGSTELSWVDLKGGGSTPSPASSPPQRLPIKAWLSIPVGVVTLAERFPEGERRRRGLVPGHGRDVKARIAAFPHAEPMRPPSSRAGPIWSAPRAPSPAWPACTWACSATTATGSTACG
jgi:exopolyphosphatase/pppGpp-phosphohydrolase